MQGGNKAEAAASPWPSAAKELENLMQQMGDAQDLQATLDALKQAPRCIGTGQGWRHAGSQGRPEAAKPGSGVGTWADEDATWDGQWTTGWDNSGS